MAQKRGGLAGLYDRNKKIIRPVAKVASIFTGNPLAMYNTNLLTKEGGGLKATVNDPLWRAQAATLAGGLAAGAMRGRAAAAKAGAMGSAAGGAAGNAGDGAGDEGQQSGGGSWLDKAVGLFTGGKGGKEGAVLKYSDVLGDIAKGIYGARKDTQDREIEREKLAENRRQFESTLGLKTREADILAAQEADRKRREADRLSARSSVRSLFGGA